MNYKILKEFLTYKANENYVCDVCSETIVKGDSYTKEYVTSRYTTAVKISQCLLS
jgi:hypothetical protein